MECRAGTIYERDSLDWMAGLYGFFFLSGYVVADTVRLKWWVGWSVFFVFFSSCPFSWMLDIFGRIFVSYSSILFSEFVVFSCGFVF